jgi:hypothetical protein
MPKAPLVTHPLRDARAVTVRDLIDAYPRLYHMTEARTWPAIERLGLLSVTALLDLLAVPPDLRRRLESDHRPHGTTLRHRRTARSSSATRSR